MLARAGFAVVLLCCATAAQAGDKPLYQAAPVWIAAAPEPDFGKLTDADPMMVLFDAQQRIDNGQVWVYLDQAMRVVSPQMLSQIGQLQLPWQPDAGDLIVHRAEIIRGGERIDLLAKGQRFQILQREEQLEKLQLDGTLTATMQVEGLRVGDVVRLSFSTTSRDKALQGNVQARMMLPADPARIQFGRARISWPSAAPVKWRAYGDGSTPQVSKAGGFEQLEVKLPLAKQPEMPGDAPARYQRPPMIELASFGDWKAVSRTFAPLYRTESLIAAGSPLAAEVAKITAKTSDPRERAALALQLVQDEVRYLYRGMDGGNYVPQTPAQTWALRYGDCKAKTLLLLAMLRALGIEGEAVLANITLGDAVSERLPSAGAFDHVLVRATIGGKSLWLDGTGNGTRLADLDDTPTFRTVLPLRIDGAELMPLAVRTATRPAMEVRIDYDQRAGLNLPTPFSATFVMRGQMAEAMRVATSQMNKEQLTNMAQGMIGSAIGDALIGERSVTYDAASATATIKASGVVGGRWEQRDGRLRQALDKTVSELTFEPDRARTAWKDIPVSTGMALSAVYAVKLRLPDNGDGFTLDGDVKLPPRLGGALYTRKAGIAAGEVSVEDRVDGTGEEIAPAAVAAARAEVAQAKGRLIEVVAPESYPARWKQVLAARKSNAFAPLLAAYAKAIADAPKEANGYSNRANFHIGVFDWKAGIADLDKAIAIEPSVGYYLQRATAKAALGNDAGALADAEAALLLDPGADGVIERTAGLRFRAGRKDEARAMLAAKAAEGGKAKNGYLNAQADLLAEEGRVDEALALFDAMVKSSPGNADLLNGRCWLKGTMNVALDTALKDCMRGIDLAERPAAIYDSRALVYYRMGRTEEALADLDAALEVAPNQTASLFLRGVIRKRSGAPGADADLAAARLMWPRIDEDYARYGIKP